MTLERTLSHLVNRAYGLTPAEIALMWQTAPPRMPTTSRPHRAWASCSSRFSMAARSSPARATTSSSSGPESTGGSLRKSSLTNRSFSEGGSVSNATNNRAVSALIYSSYDLPGRLSSNRQRGIQASHSDSRAVPRKDARTGSAYSAFVTCYPLPVVLGRRSGRSWAIWEHKKPICARLHPRSVQYVRGRKHQFPISSISL